MKLSYDEDMCAAIISEERFRYCTGGKILESQNQNLLL